MKKIFLISMSLLVLVIGIACVSAANCDVEGISDSAIDSRLVIDEAVTDEENDCNLNIDDERLEIEEDKGLSEIESYDKSLESEISNIDSVSINENKAIDESINMKSKSLKSENNVKTVYAKQESAPQVFASAKEEIQGPIISLKEKLDPNLDAFIADIEFGERPRVIVITDCNFNGRISFTCPEFSYKYKMPTEDGLIHYEFKEDLAPGTYTVKISFEGNSIFKATETTVTFTVK